MTFLKALFISMVPFLFVLLFWAFAHFCMFKLTHILYFTGSKLSDLVLVFRLSVLKFDSLFRSELRLPLPDWLGCLSGESPLVVSLRRAALGEMCPCGRAKCPRCSERCRRKVVRAFFGGKVPRDFQKSVLGEEEQATSKVKRIMYAMYLPQCTFIWSVPAPINLFLMECLCLNASI